MSTMANFLNPFSQKPRLQRRTSFLAPSTGASIIGWWQRKSKLIHGRSSTRYEVSSHSQFFAPSACRKVTLTNNVLHLPTNRNESKKLITFTTLSIALNGYHTGLSMLKVGTPNIVTAYLSVCTDSQIDSALSLLVEVFQRHSMVRIQPTAAVIILDSTALMKTSNVTCFSLRSRSALWPENGD